ERYKNNEKQICECIAKGQPKAGQHTWLAPFPPVPCNQIGHQASKLQVTPASCRSYSSLIDRMRTGRSMILLKPAAWLNWLAYRFGRKCHHHQSALAEPFSNHRRADRQWSQA